MYPDSSLSLSLSSSLPHPLRLSPLCSYVTASKSVTPVFLMLLQELQRCYSEVSHF